MEGGDLRVNRLSTEISAAERARWLAELADALEQAERLLWSLSDLPTIDPNVRELYGSLDAARAEVQALRSKRALALQRNVQPLWIEFAQTPEFRKDC